MTNYSLITNQNFDINGTKKPMPEFDKENDLDDYLNFVKKDNLLSEKKKPLLSQKEIDDFFLDHDDHVPPSINNSLDRDDKIKTDNSNKGFLARKHISLRTLLIIIFSFVTGAILSGMVVVGYYNLKNSFSTADERLPEFEDKIVKNQILIEDIKTRIDELSMRIDAVTNHLIQNGKNEKNQINSNDNVDKR